MSIDRIKKLIDRYMRKPRTKQECFDLLVKQGFIDEKGNVTKEYGGSS